MKIYMIIQKLNIKIYQPKLILYVKNMENLNNHLVDIYMGMGVRNVVEIS